MAKANLQEQARDLGLSDDGTVAELIDRIEEAGYEPDDEYQGETEPVSDEPEQEEVQEQSQEDAETAAVVIPEYEQQISAAAARGDDTEIARLQEEYWGARQERAQQNREAAEAESEE